MKQFVRGLVGISAILGSVAFGSATGMIDGMAAQLDVAPMRGGESSALPKTRVVLTTTEKMQLASGYSMSCSSNPDMEREISDVLVGQTFVVPKFGEITIREIDCKVGVALATDKAGNSITLVER